MKYLYSDLPPVDLAGRELVGRMLFTALVLAAAVVGAFSGVLIVYSTDLPQVGELERYRPSSITELYDDQGRVIGSFALQRRVIASYDDFPKVLRQAVLSIEDKSFEEHWGVNFWRAMGAAYRDIASGSRAQGASTLTMQLSRNLFLSPERSFGRKIQEIILAIQIERRFTKAQIFSMYANQIFLGHGVYGFEAGAQYYFNKPAKLLTLDEAALLAGLPKAPNAYSPINNPERALRRRNLVINAMLEDGKITAEEASRARNVPLKLDVQAGSNSMAPNFVEEVRRYLERKYGSDQVHQGGLRVYTSLNLDLQKTATQAILDGLAAYERRQGWKGHLENILLPQENPNPRSTGRAPLESYSHPDWNQLLEPGGYVHALVTNLEGASAVVKFGHYAATLSPAKMAWTHARTAREILSRGDLVYVKIISLYPDGGAELTLEQDSGTQGALLALDNASGDIKAMVGGRDFEQSKFNR